MLNEPQKKKFADFYESVKNNGTFDPKTTLLLHLAAAMGVGCIPCMEHYLKEAWRTGVTEEEIGAVQGVVMAVSAGKVKAQLREAELRLK